MRIIELFRIGLLIYSCLPIGQLQANEILSLSVSQDVASLSLLYKYYITYYCITSVNAAPLSVSVLKTMVVFRNSRRSKSRVYYHFIYE